jgi:ABC-type amino acid transport substrate-binding protein
MVWYFFVEILTISWHFASFVFSLEQFYFNKEGSLNFKLFIMLISLLLSISVYAGDKKITLATLEWEPYVGKKLKNNGFISEIIQKAFKKKGYRVDLIFYPWARGMIMTERGKVHGIFPAYYNDERNKKYIISDSYGSGELGFYKRRESKISFVADPVKEPEKVLQALKKYRFGIVRGFAYTKEFDAADYLIKDIVKDDQTNLKKLFRSRIDLAFIDKYVARYIMHRKYPHYIDDLTFMNPAMEEKKLFICFSRAIEGMDKIVRDFNEGLTQLKTSGEMVLIMNSHGF